MKLNGLKIKGLNIVPVPLKTLDVAPIKYDGAAVMSFCSDIAVKDTAYYVEALLFKYNLKATLFDSPFDSDVFNYLTEGERQDICSTGKIKWQIYFQTDRWADPYNTGASDFKTKYPLIPSYLSATWTQEAVDKGVVDSSKLGQSKTIYYPDHGSQLYSESAGKYGFDGTNYGLTDIISDLLQYHKDWCKSTFGYYPSVMSYRNGRTGCSYAVPLKYIGARNSVADYDVKYSELTKDLAKLLTLTTRWYDFVHSLGVCASYADSYTLCGQKLDNAVANNGWYRDFTHWHGVVAPDTGELENYFSNMITHASGKNVVNLEMGEAIEYKFLKDITRRVNLYDNNGSLSILVDYKDGITIPKDGINSTLTVRLNLVGTSLQGKEIAADNADIIKVITDNFLVQVPFNCEGFESVIIKETDSPSYMTFTVPTGIKSINGTTLTATSNVPCKFVVYQKSSGSDLSTVQPVARYNGLQTSITVTIDSIKDTYVGIVDKYGNSALI